MRVLLRGFILVLTLSMLSWTASSAEPVDVRLIIDVSGSMKRNDPQNLRQPAVELLVELLPEDSSAGVWTFGKWVNMLVKHETVDDSWRSVASGKARDISSVGLFTNIGEALEKAAYDADYTDSSQKKHIILLTDGMVDIDKEPSVNKREWRRIVDELIPNLKDSGYVVHTIALSKNADRDLMNKISVATDGVADIAESADDLMNIFLEAFDAAVPAEQVALEGNSFVIDSSVEEFTALFFKNDLLAPTELVSPDQVVYNVSSRDPDIKWHSSKKYDLVTVKRPLEGSWGVIGDLQPGSRVTVVSNLNLRLKPLPINVLKGATLDLEALLLEDGTVISNPEFLELMDVKAELFGGTKSTEMVSIWDGELTAQNMAEGRYSGTLPELTREGVYRLVIEVDGKTFTRAVKHQMTLREAFSADIREKFEDGETKYVLTVNAFQQDVNYQNSQIVATITTPDKQKIVRALSLSDLDAWQTVVDPTSEGLYEVVVKVKGVGMDGTRFEYFLDPLSFNYSVDGGMAAKTEPFVDEPEPEPEEPVKEEPKAEDKPDESKAVPETAPEASEALPEWILYAVLGAGNFLILGLGFFAYKKIMGGPKEDPLEELEQELEAKEEVTATEEATPVEEEQGAEEPEEDEEPPMEDLDPDPEPVPASEPEPEPEEEPEPELELLDEDDDDEDIGDSELFTPDDVSEILEPDEDKGEDPGMELLDDLDDDDDSEVELDDLETMAMEQQESDQGDSDAELFSEGGEEEEEEDMATAMLKAQGLDLAEEELDDAISSLIDELEDDEDDDDETKGL